MLDTNRLRFHGILDRYEDAQHIIREETTGVDTHVIPQHHELYAKMLNYKGKYFNKVQVINREVEVKADLTGSEFLHMENSKKLNFHLQKKKYMRFQDARTIKDVVMRTNGSWSVPSSYSGVAFSINESASFIDFEFSIPKYLYGHNLAEFIPQDLSQRKWQHGSKLFDFKFQLDLLYDRYIEFIESFITDLCIHFKIDTLPDMRYIEVRRLDFCYNQYFDTKEDSLLFLEYQKKLNKKRRRANSSPTETRDTSLSYVSTGGSYFKIYNKGAEYVSETGDLKKHMKVNKPFIDNLPMGPNTRLSYKQNREMLFNVFETKAKGNDVLISDTKKRELNELNRKFKSFMPYDVIFLKSEMDKVLRYEVSLRTPFFSYAHKQKIFRKRDKIHKQYFSKYKKLKASQKRGEKLKPKDLIFYKNFHKWFTSTTNFVFKNNSEMRSHTNRVGKDYNDLTETYKPSKYNYPNTLLQDKDVAMFSKDLIKLCWNHFKETIDTFQIKKIDGFDDIATKVRDYNKNVELRIQKYNEVHSLDCIKKNGDRIIRNGKPLMKAVLLLSDTEKRAKRLKKVNPNIILMLVRELEKGISLDQFRKKAGLTNSTFWRYKKDLEMFGIYQNSLSTTLDLNPPLDFTNYYWNTQGINYQDKFYLNPEMSKYDTKHKTFLD